MIKLKHIRLKQAGLCGPSALKMIMDHYDVIVSEDELCQIAGASIKKGTTYNGLAKAAKHFGFLVFLKEKSSLNDLRYFIRKGIPVIVDWFLEDDGHYSVVVDITARNVTLMDPSLKEGDRKLSTRKFLRIWFDFEGDFIKDPSDLILRLILVIIPPKLQNFEEWPDGFRKN